MTKARQDFEDEILAKGSVEGDPEDVDDTTDPKIEHAGSSVKEGLHGGSRRAAARGRNEFPSRGDSAAYDTNRAEQGGRHYGRLGPEDPGPRFQRPPQNDLKGKHPERSPRDEGATHEQTGSHEKK